MKNEFVMFVGPMFGGKTTKLLSAIDRYKYQGRKILAFKPNVDDLRESPAVEILEELLQKDLDLIICEPNLDKYKNFKLESLQNIIQKSDLIIFLVAHESFKFIKFSEISFLDFCGVSQT